MGTPQLAALLLLLALPQFAPAGASDMEAISPSPWNRDASLPRKWTKGTAAAALFCGSAAGSCCCSVEDDHKLREAFVAEVEAHGYHDAECRSELNAYLCKVCLAAPASDPFNGNTTNSSLPLGCAAAPSSSGSIHDVTSEPPPRPGYWLPADDDNQASKMPTWLIALISIIGTLLTGLLSYSAKLVCCNNCCNHNKFFVREAN